MYKYEYVSKTKAIITALTSLSPGLIIFTLSILGTIEFNFGILAIAISVVITVSSLLIFRSKVIGPLESIDAKIPYIYLFMEMFLKAGIPPETAIKQISELLEDPVLYRLYRYIAVGVNYEEALRRVFGKIYSEGRTYIENLLRSGIFGLPGLRYIKETVLKLLNEREKEIEKTVKQISILVEVYTVLGVFAPLATAVTIASLSILGVTLLNPVSIVLLLIAITIAVMIIISYLATSIVRKVTT